MEVEERKGEVRPFCRGEERVRIVLLVGSWRLLRVILKNRFIFVLRGRVLLLYPLDALLCAMYDFHDSFAPLVVVYPQEIQKILLYFGNVLSGIFFI